MHTSKYEWMYNSTYSPFTFTTCGGCATWGNRTPPAGLSPFSNCAANSAGECLQGCAYSHGAAVAPLFPETNATTCGCRTWSSVPCDGGVKGQVNQWPCDPYNRTGAVFWYCEDGPGWKPPMALRERAHELAREQVQEAMTLQQQNVRLPKSPKNPFETIWAAAPLKSGPDAHSVVLDLSGSDFEGGPSIYINTPHISSTIHLTY
jgi:hypothetical protein